jgi:saccharopine dehydrogenase (NAD+, L-lysine-forming)
MTFSEQYLNYLKVIQDIGMANIRPIYFEGNWIVPIKFLSAVLPKPAELGKTYKGETSIGVRIRGIGQEDNVIGYYVWNNCKHEEAYKETGTQAVNYTTGVPAMIGALLCMTGEWKKPGVWNTEQFNPDPFMERLIMHGLPWKEQLEA